MRGRFAPSPTGQMHMGNAWTALLAWLQVRAAGGTMVLRLEDLDPDRSRSAYGEELLADLRWLGLDWDEGPDVGGSHGPYCQGERRASYQAAVAILAARGLVYPCYCTRAQLAAAAPHVGEGEPAYAGTCRQRRDVPSERRPSLRVRIAAETVCFTDLVYGAVQQKLAEAVGDFVVRRADGVHAYQLAVVLDDAAMNITHVLRGHDLLASTPRQLYLYKLLGLTPPVFAHVPLLLGEDGARLSKRHGDLSIAALRQQGITPAAIIGYLGWQAGLLPELRPLAAQELIAAFHVERIKKDPVIIPGNLSEILTAWR